MLARHFTNKVLYNQSDSLQALWVMCIYVRVCSFLVEVRDFYMWVGGRHLLLLRSVSIICSIVALCENSPLHFHMSGCKSRSRTCWQSKRSTWFLPSLQREVWLCVCVRFCAASLTSCSPERTSRRRISMRPSRRSVYRSPMRQVTRPKWEFTHLVKVFFCTASRSSAGGHSGQRRWSTTTGIHLCDHWLQINEWTDKSGKSQVPTE